MDRDPGGLIAALILAAGSSSRMGRNKLLLELDGEPLVRRAARTALEAGLSPVLLVTGFEAERVAGALRGLTARTVVNPRHAEGIHTSLRAGVEALPGECAAAVIILPDMPLVTAAMIAEIVARFQAGAEPLVLSLYGEVQAPPTLYARSLFPALATTGPEGGREVVARHRHAAAVLRWPAELLADLDDPGDPARLGVRARELPSRGPVS